MKKGRLLFVLVTCLLLVAGAALAQEDVHKSPSCAYCGMDRAKFAHSRMFVTYDDGSTFGACALTTSRWAA